MLIGLPTSLKIKWDELKICLLPRLDQASEHGTPTEQRLGVKICSPPRQTWQLDNSEDGTPTEQRQGSHAVQLDQDSEVRK